MQSKACRRNEDYEEVAAYFIEMMILAAMDALRSSCDELETIDITENYWPFPTYGKLIIWNFIINKERR